MTAPAYLPTDLQASLAHARHLAECGVPIFIAEPVLDSDGSWMPNGGAGGFGYHLPKMWQFSEADPRVVDRWRVGQALCAVMGYAVDGVDVDPRNGGDRSVVHMKRSGLMPRSYGRQTTPSGGTHDLVAPLGIRKTQGILPGIDLQAGISGEGGHGFLFLAPTVKMSKTGEMGMYTWEVEPHLDELILIGGDTSGEALAALVAERTTRVYDGPAYVGRGYDDLNDAERAWSDQHVEGVAAHWRGVLEEAVSWDEGVADSKGRGWEGLSYQWAWTCARLAVTPWTRLDEDEAEEMFNSVLPAEIAEACPGKWGRGLVSKAAERPVEPPPWDGLSVLRDRERIDASREAVAAEWLLNEIGMEGTPLAGLFRRGDELVHTPRIDEDGYVSLSPGDRDEDGPAQVRVAGVDKVQARIQFAYRVTKRLQSGRVDPHMFPKDAIRVVLGDTGLAPNLRTLRGVTHTPMLRQDGTVLDVVGYDEVSGRLFLPEPGLAVGRVPEKPSEEEVERARDLLLRMIADFPFNTEHDRANYLALLLTPLLRELIPPPYKMGAINAHQPGSGKSLLAWILRTVHGGVLRGDVPADGAEFSKQITSVLYATTAPVVQFDNVRHLEASQLDALLTTDTWTDRVLGASTMVTSRNDRLWVATGNNISLGGDLVRRVLWITIDPKTPHPEARVDFRIADLKGWVRDRRGEILVALLTLCRAWVVAGCPVEEKVGSDDYARWIEACRGILALAGVPGLVAHEDSVKQTVTEDGDEWGAFLASIYEKKGDSTWTAGELADLALLDEAPDGLNVASSRSVGRWLSNRDGRWFGDYCVRQVGVGGNGHSKVWKIERYTV